MTQHEYDPRLRAFLAADAPEIFHSVATPTAIWRPDPFDIDSIHAPAREAFTKVLVRAGRTPAAPSGSVLVVLGEAGSGKTHLMRAFRNQTHTSGNGYCGYMQMTTEAGSYSRYMLNNLISDLEKPHTPDSTRTSLNRLSSALLEKVPGLDAEGREQFRDGSGNTSELVDEYVDRLKELPEYSTCDLYLLRVLMHLERNDNKVRSRALMWLRCLDMKSSDRKWIGEAVPKTDDADPDRMIRHLAEIMRVTSGSPLVLLVDQLEDMSKQDRPTERFRKVVDTITSLADQNSNVVVVMACLEDYFRLNQNEIGTAKQQRLMNDPPPVVMRANCTVDDIRAMACNRLQYLYDEAGVDADPADPLYPFNEHQIAEIAGVSPREVLLSFLRHHQRCMAEGRWIQPWVGKTTTTTAADPISPLWNDFENAFTFPLDELDEEHEYAAAIASAVRNIAPELPEGNHFGTPQADGRYLKLELQQPDGGLAKMLVAVCNKGGQGRGLLNQLIEVEKRAGDIPVSILRTINFPRTGQAMEKIGKMLKTHGSAVVVQDSDWRRMLAFAAFRQQHANRSEFEAWQKETRPLGELPSLQKLLKLDQLKARPARVEVMATDTVFAPPPTPKKPSESPNPVPTASKEPAEKLNGGDTIGLAPKPVQFDSLEFTRHAAFLGGAGSGKTTAALNLIEQLLASGVPAILIDRKGDLCRYAVDSAWDRPLSHPSRDTARRKLKSMLDVEVFTPGAPSGRPLAIPVVPPGFDQLGEFEREEFARFAANALAGMMNFRTSDADNAQRVILAKAIETLASIPGTPIDLPSLRAIIGESEPALVASVGSYKPQYFERLAERLTTLNHTYKHLFQGCETLDVGTLLSVRPGRARLTVVSTRFLGDAADFWVAQFLIAVSRHCAKAPKKYLQAVLMFDEADAYIPASGPKPASKEPMEDLLRRARSAGVGLFLATQSPGDLDYKCRENITTWFIGRIGQNTAIEKLKPILAAKPNAVDKLGTQPTGQFHLVRESGIVEMKSFESFLKTEQQSEEEILALARRGQPQIG